MLLNFFLIFIIFDNISNAMEGPNPQDVIEVLSHKYHDFKEATEELLNEQTNLLSRIKANLISGLKSYLIIEPTEKETKEADEAMANSYAIGCHRLPDTIEKMNEFCANGKERNAIISNWVTRRFTFNLIVRLSNNLSLKKIAHKNEIYCANQTNKQYYVKNAQDIKDLKLKLRDIRVKFIDTLIAVEKSNFGIGRLATFCCSYWNYKNETLSAIPNLENRRFFSDMIEEYYGLSINYLCFYHTEGSKICSGVTPSPHSPNDYISLGIHVENAISKISQIVL